MSTRWIVVDGIDGSGKNTHAKIIKTYYEEMGEKVSLVIHPSDCVWGRLSRQALRNTGMLMQFLASAFFLLDVLSTLRRRDVWEGHDTVITVRYLMATAYLPGKLAKISYDFFRRLLPIPNRLLLVDTKPRLAMERIALRNHEREMFETLPKLEEMRLKMLSMAGKEWHILDNTGTSIESNRRLLFILSEWDSSLGEERGPY
jgi:dTMP kinase